MAQTGPSRPEALPALAVLQEHFPDPVSVVNVVRGIGDDQLELPHVLRGLQDLEHNGLAVVTGEGTWAATAAGNDYSL